jgi:microcystin-dependent protein
MAEPFLGEIKIMSFQFAPKGWAFCNGQILPINQNQALFQLLGDTYGGNRQTTFGLPDLRARVPIHRGNGHNVGEQGGAVNVIVGIPQLPAHPHVAQATNAAANSDDATNKVLGQAGQNVYAAFGGAVAMGNAAISTVGGGAAHNNLMPCLALNFCIALVGIFPSQS